MKPTAIIPAGGVALSPPLLEAEAALVQRLRDASITLPDVETRAGMLARAKDLDDRAAGMKVRKPDDFTAAGELLKEVKTELKANNEEFAKLPIIKRTLDAWRNQYTTTLETIEANLKAEMNAWMQAEEERRRKREAEERAKAEAEAAAEQKRLAEEAKKASEKAKAEGDKEGAKALAQEAKAIASAPVAVAPVHVESRVPKVSGISSRSSVKGEVADPVALVRWLLDHPEHIAPTDPTRKPAITFTQSWLDAQAKAGVKIPGLECRKESGIAAGAR